MPDEASGNSLPGPASVERKRPPRPSIAERAAKREAMARGTDRYQSLVRALRAGREIQLERRRRGEFHLDLDWNPVAGKLLVLVLVVALACMGLRIGSDWLRRDRVDTWAGPDATVTSGQEIASCVDAALVETDNIYPSWVRWQGRNLLRTDRVRPGAIDGVRYIDSGYSLGDMRLVKLMNSDAGRAGDEAMVWVPGTLGGYVYRTNPGCP
jgi:hypothetical protein